MLKMNDKSATCEYSEKLFNGEYFEQLGEELEEEIGNVVEGGCLNIWLIESGLVMVVYLFGYILASLLAIKKFYVF